MLVALLCLVLPPPAADAQKTGTLEVFAGVPEHFGVTGDGEAATRAELAFPEFIVADPRGNTLIANAGGEGTSDEQVQIVDGEAAPCAAPACPYGLASMQPGHLYTVAGEPGVAGFYGDNGPAVKAHFGDFAGGVPLGLAVDHHGNLFIADGGNFVDAGDFAGNDRIRMVAGSTCTSECPFGLTSTIAGDIYTVAGNGEEATGANGANALLSGLGLPVGVAVDAEGNLLVTATNKVWDATTKTEEHSVNASLRLIAARSCASGCPYGLHAMTKGDAYTIAGRPESTKEYFELEGTEEFGAGKAATEAELFHLFGVTTDATGDPVFAQEADGGILWLLATHNCTSAATCPFDLSSMTEGHLYAVAGKGRRKGTKPEGDGGPGTAAVINPAGLATDALGDLLIGEGARVRLLAAAGCSSSCPYGLPAMTKGDIYTVAGTGNKEQAPKFGEPATATPLADAFGVAVDPLGNLLVSVWDGQYIGRVANAALPGKPQVTLQPASQSALVGEPAAFTAQASGNPAPSVSWQYRAPGGAAWTEVPGQRRRR